MSPYHMPAEWEPHEATWLSWPHNPETWPGIPLQKIEDVWVQMVKALNPSEKVYINGGRQKDCARIKDLFKQNEINLSQIVLYPFATNDAWVRDHGPIFVYDPKTSKRIVLDWDYNAWGGKYPPYDLDNKIPKQIASQLNFERIAPHLVLEGGSIDTNGCGTLLTTESCLLNPNRNPELSKAKIESQLKHYLGVQKILWLGEGIVGDDTDGHVDDITRFVGERHIVTAVEEDPQDENYRPLQDNLKRLQKMTDVQNHPLEIIQLPMPAAIHDPTGGRLPASYANFYIGNQVVLVPIFHDPKDALALKTLADLFPNRKVIGIDCRELITGLGALHCVTQQMPA